MRAPLRAWTAFALAAACVVAASLTGRKLYRVAQVRGFVGGAETAMVQVVEKGWDGEGHWVRWVGPGPRDLPEGRVNLETGAWQRTEPGSPVLVVRLPNGHVDARDGASAANGPLALLAALGLLELAAGALLLHGGWALRRGAG